MPRMKGAELITDYLIANDIPYVFGICGHGNVGMLDPLYEARDRIKLVSPRHEQVAAHMADAYFRVRHQPVATLTSCGPGSANIVMPLACALTDSSAVFAITANVPTSQFNRSPFQEINRHFQADFVNVLRPVVKRSFQPTRVDMLPLALRQAMTTMLSGRPGPVNIDVPFNVFQEEDDVDMPPPAPPFNTQRSGASPDDIARALDMILAAQRPVLFIGHGVTLSEASRELTEFAKKLGIPVISSPNGMGCIDMTDPLSLGFIGRNGAFPANEAGRRSDVVIAIGGRFDDRSASSWMPGYSWNFPHTKLIHVDVDPAELGRNYPPDLGILADARTFLRQLLAELERRSAKSNTKEWLADIAKWRAEWETFVRPNFDIHASPMRPERVVADCQAVLPADGIICCDVGVSHNWY
ncbi:MAG: thiamine pyrophosphate-binding protein, partial [Xanthobacteraceae bacterium]